MNNRLLAETINDHSELRVTVLFEYPEELEGEKDLIGRFDVTLINEGPHSYLTLINKNDLFSGFSMIGNNGHIPVQTDIRHVRSLAKPQALTAKDFQIFRPGERLYLGTGQITIFEHSSRLNIHVSYGPIVVSSLEPGEYTASLQFSLGNFGNEAAQKMLIENPNLIAETTPLQYEFKINIPEEF